MYWLFFREMQQKTKLILSEKELFMMSVKPEVLEIGDKIRLVRVQTAPAKTTCVSVELLMPLGEQTAAYTVLASYLTHCTEKFPSLNLLNERLELLYGAQLSCNTSKFGEGFRLSFQAVCLNDRYALDGESVCTAALSLLLDLLLCPYLENGTFSAERTAQEIRLCAADLESELNDKRAYALRRMVETMCKDEPYGIRTDDILKAMRALTGDDLLAAWKKLLCEAHIAVCAAGDLDFDALSESLKTRFAALPRYPKPIETQFVVSAAAPTETVESMDVNQSKLVLGFRSGMTSPDDNYYATRVMVDVFGGGPYSRLFTQVREKLSLCYYCSARLDRRKGIIAVQSGIESENKQAALEEILRQVAVMQNGEFSDDVLQASKAALADLFRSVDDTPETALGYYSQFIDEPMCTPAEYIAGVERVTREDVIAAAKRMTLDTVYFLSGKEEA